MTNDKQPNALKTIGEVAELLGLPSYVIRFWEAKMPSLAPIKRQGRRYYSPANDTSTKYTALMKSHQEKTNNYSLSM